MSDYEHSATVECGPDRLFAYLADISHLPDYFDSMVSAEPAGGRRVDVVADVAGTRREGEAWLEADESSRSMRWGAPGPSSYSGELSVTGGAGGSTVTVTLHTERADGPGIRAGLEQTLANIKRVVEGSSTDRA